MKMNNRLYRSLVSLMIVAAFLGSFVSFLRHNSALDQVALIPSASACTWVTTSCGSGCADDQKLYNCSNTVTITSVSPSSSNADSNAKAQAVAPPTVSQYVPPVDNSAQVQYQVDQNTQKAIEYVQSTPGQTVGGDVKTVDQTGLGGNVIEAVGTNATVTRNGVIAGSDGSLSGGFRGTCSTDSNTASICRGAAVGTVTSGLVCVPKAQAENSNESWCSAMTQAEVDSFGADSDGDGVYDSFVFKGNEGNGGCAFVVSCNCGDTVKQHCAWDNAFGPKSVGAHCAANVCPAVDGVDKKCEPGTFQCLNDGTTRGYSCKYNGSGYNDTAPVNAHACGATYSTVFEYCRQDSQGVTSSDLCYATYQECNDARATGEYCVRGNSQAKIDPGKQYCCAMDPTLGVVCTQDFNVPADLGADVCQISDASNDTLGGKVVGHDTSKACAPGETYRTFAGCGAGTQSTYNCYNGCLAGVKYTNKCVNEPGLSCGAVPYSPPITTVEVPPTPAPTPTPTPTPTAQCNQACGDAAGGAVCNDGTTCFEGVCRNPQCSPSEQNAQCVCEEKPVAPMCVDIYASIAVPKLNDQVTFTCAQVTNATRYEFRYGYTTSKDDISDIELTALSSSTATSNVSLPITVDKVGRYVAQCRPCAGNDLCSEWEPLGGQIGAPQLPPTESPETEVNGDNASNPNSQFPTFGASTIAGEYEFNPVACELRVWAVDVDNPNESITVDLIVADNPNFENIVRFYNGVTNVVRTEINERYGLTGAHGFEYDTSSLENIYDTGLYFYLTGNNISGTAGNNSWIHPEPVQLKCIGEPPTNNDQPDADNSENEPNSNEVAYDESICWNNVVASRGSYSWRSTCSLNPIPGVFCPAVVRNLTADEITNYEVWVAAGSPALSSCVTPEVNSRIDDINNPTFPVETPQLQ